MDIDYEEDDNFQDDNIESNDNEDTQTLEFSPQFINVTSPNELIRIKQSFRYIIDKLTFANEKVSIEIKNGISQGTIKCSISEFNKHIAEIEKNNDYFLLAKNYSNIYNQIFNRLEDIREGLLSRFQDMLVRMERGDFAKKQLHKNVEQLRSALEFERKQKDEIRNQLHQNIIQKFENRLIELEEKLAEAKSNNLISVERKKQFSQEKSIIIDDSDSKQKQGESASVSTTEKSPDVDQEVNDVLKETIQMVHMETIDIVKSLGLYPLNKQDDKKLLEAYIREGKFYYESRGLNIEEHMPSFMENASDYKDKPDDYLDDIFEFEKSEEKNGR